MLKFLRIALAILLAVHVSACDRDGSPPSQTGAQTDTVPTEIGDALYGQAEYERACGRCHDEGLDGAPRTRDRAAWASRSALWEAVLFEHATNGYLEMPAMGGTSDLTEREVKAAAEYMLSITHPDLTPDPH